MPKTKLTPEEIAAETEKQRVAAEVEAAEAAMREEEKNIPEAIRRIKAVAASYGKTTKREERELKKARRAEADLSNSEIS
jgi:hypothetical protein